MCVARNDFSHAGQKFIYESLVDIFADDHRVKRRVIGVRAPTLLRDQLAAHVRTLLSDEAYAEHIMQGTFPEAHQRYCSYHHSERFAQKMLHKDKSTPVLDSLLSTTLY